MAEINITLNTQKKPKTPDDQLGFGKFFTDHMFVMDYYRGKGWVDPRIVPYAPLTMEPSCACLHYGQEVFEGMKAYRHPDGSAALFRPELNFERLNLSCDRLCIPTLDVDFALEALKKLVDIDQDWIPTSPGTSLYIRPFVIAADDCLGIKITDHFMFMIIMSPVGPYYKGGIKPVGIFVETEYVRAARGGVGHTKTGGNYAASLKSLDKALALGYSQVLWLDASERKYIEEVGAMNVFFKIDGEIITPALSGSILSGITRRSCIEMLSAWGYPVSEKRLSIDEVMAAGKDGRLEEVFGTGTAAVISSVGSLRCGDDIATVADGQIGTVTQKLYDNLVGIQTGTVTDSFGWTIKV